MLLIAAGVSGKAVDAARVNLAAEEAELTAERQRVGVEADAKVAEFVVAADRALELGNPRLADEMLDAAVKVPNATDGGSVRRLRTRLANAKAAALTASAQAVLEAGDVDAAQSKVHEALAVRDTDDVADARKLDRAIRDATDTTRIADVLVGLSDEAFLRFRSEGVLPPELVSGNPALDRRAAEVGKRAVAQAADVREKRRLAKIEAERQREEAQRMRMEEANRKSEAARMAAERERERNAAMAAEARRKAEEEYDVNGLVLLKKSVKGTSGEFSGEISGMVVNRRSRKLSYAQITFNLYDESGAQVGSALANINGLEPGGTWKFKASTFGTDFSSYKFSELSGF